MCTTCWRNWPPNVFYRDLRGNKSARFARGTDASLSAGLPVLLQFAARLAALDHVQVSLQDVEAASADAAETIPGLTFWSVRDYPLSQIWQDPPAFQAFRGIEWMREPCRSCELRDIDFGGCRCQAMALAGDPAATDPARELSSLHAHIGELAAREAATPKRSVLIQFSRSDRKDLALQGASNRTTQNYVRLWSGTERLSL